NPVVILATAYRGSRLPGSPPRVPPVNLLPADPPGPHFLFSGPRHARIPSFRTRRLLPADGPPVADRGAGGGVCLHPGVFGAVHPAGIAAGPACVRGGNRQRGRDDG